MLHKLPRSKRPYLLLPRACLPTWRTNDCPRRRRALNARCSPVPRWGDFLTHRLLRSAWAIPCWTRTRTRTPSPASYKTRWMQCQTWGVGLFPCTQVVRTPYLTPPRPRTHSWASSTQRTSRLNRQGGLDARLEGFSAKHTSTTPTPHTLNEHNFNKMVSPSTPQPTHYSRPGLVLEGFSPLPAVVLLLWSVVLVLLVRRS